MKQAPPSSTFATVQAVTVHHQIVATWRKRNMSEREKKIDELIKRVERMETIVTLIQKQLKTSSKS